MKPFPRHTLESAPKASKPLLENTAKDWGFVPIMHSIMAESPQTLEAYQHLFRLSLSGTLTPGEAQLVFLTTSVFHECEYCTAGHTRLALGTDLPQDAIQGVRNGKTIANPRLQALREFTEAVVRQRGWVGDAAVDKVIAAGFTQANVLEVALIITCKTLSNYLNHITHPQLESFMSDPAVKWNAPKGKNLAAA